MKDKMWDFFKKGQNSCGNPEGLENLVDERWPEIKKLFEKENKQ